MGGSWYPRRRFFGARQAGGRVTGGREARPGPAHPVRERPGLGGRLGAEQQRSEVRAERAEHQRAVQAVAGAEHTAVSGRRPCQLVRDPGFQTMIAVLALKWPRSARIHDQRMVTT
jgi:hypothetical protein